MLKPLGHNMNAKFLAVVCILGLQIELASAENHKLQHPAQYHQKKKYQKPQKSEFDLIPLNAPIKESVAKFLLKTPAGFDIQQIAYLLLSSTDLIEKNRNYSVAKLIIGPKGKELHIPMANYKSGFYKLFVKVKTKKTGDEEHHYRSAYHDYAKFSYEKSLKVPAPDPEINDSTLLGIDSDNNEIRDDVQIWINQTYNPTAFPSTNNALKQITRHHQLAIKNYLDKEVAVPYYLKALEGLECIMWIKHNGHSSYKDLQTKFLNTPERIKAFMKVDSYRDGSERPENISQTKTTERHQFCEFTPTKE